MDYESLMKFLSVLEKLKCNTRHSWTSSGRQESVAEHSWRLAVLWLLVGREIPDAKFDRVLRMCLIHDFGEAVCGDIPSFNKTNTDEEEETQAVEQMLAILPEPIRCEFSDLFREMHEMKTKEARVWRALDMMEASIQHNEADIRTWLPLEYELNPIYGEEEAQCDEYLKKLRQAVRNVTEEKISKEHS